MPCPPRPPAARTDHVAQYGCSAIQQISQTNDMEMACVLLELVSPEFRQLVQVRAVNALATRSFGGLRTGLLQGREPPKGRSCLT